MGWADPITYWRIASFPALGKHINGNNLDFHSIVSPHRYKPTVDRTPSIVWPIVSAEFYSFLLDLGNTSTLRH